MTDIFEDYLFAKYAKGGPDSDRFEDSDDEIHTSEVGRCQRRLWYERRHPQGAEYSPYFELGRVFEVLYGAALAWRYGDLDEADLADNKPWELAGMVDAVEQDVNIRIGLDGFSIPGEADWVVYREGVLDEVAAHGGVDLVELNCGDLARGGRRVTYDDGHQVVLEEGEPTPVDTVVETKTIKDLSILGGSPKESHHHQLWGYMWALNAPGRWAYMVRDDLETVHHEQPLDESLFTDVELRARQHRRNLAEDEYPVANPSNKWECHWCPHRNDCAGSLG